MLAVSLLTFCGPGHHDADRCWGGGLIQENKKNTKQEDRGGSERLDRTLGAEEEPKLDIRHVWNRVHLGKEAALKQQDGHDGGENGEKKVS